MSDYNNCLHYEIKKVIPKGAFRLGLFDKLRIDYSGQTDVKPLILDFVDSLEDKIHHTISFMNLRPLNDRDHAGGEKLSRLYLQCSDIEGFNGWINVRTNPLRNSIDLPSLLSPYVSFCLGSIPGFDGEEFLEDFARERLHPRYQLQTA